VFLDLLARSVANALAAVVVPLDQGPTCFSSSPPTVSFAQPVLWPSLARRLSDFFGLVILDDDTVVALLAYVRIIP
jgi:hypothetical protein